MFIIDTDDSISSGYSSVILFGPDIAYESDGGNDVVVVSALNKNMTSVDLSNVNIDGEDYTVVGIADRAFINSKSLVSITIPNSVTSIDYMAFMGCTSLTSITIPNSVTSIAPGMFIHCTTLESVMIPDSVIEIGNSAFSGCISLMSIEIPSSVTSIGNNAFSNCTSLISLDLHDGTMTIGNMAFYGCTALRSIVLPNVPYNMLFTAFVGCTSLTDVAGPYEQVAYIALENGIDLKNAYFTGDLSPEFDERITPRINMFHHVSNDTWNSEPSVGTFVFISYYSGEGEFLASIPTDSKSPQKANIPGYRNVVWKLPDGTEYDFDSELMDDVALYAEYRITYLEIGIIASFAAAIIGLFALAIIRR